MIKHSVCAAAAALLALPGLAWPISPENAGTVLTRADSEDVNVVWLNDQAARIDAKRGDYQYSVRIMDCDETKACATAMIFATFEMTGTPDFAMYEKTNLFNDSFPYGRAFILPRADNQSYAVGVDYSLDLRNEANFDVEDVSKFMSILGAYIDHMSQQE